MISPTGRVLFAPSLWQPDDRDRKAVKLYFPEGTDLTEMREAAQHALDEKFGDGKVKLDKLVGNSQPFQQQDDGSTAVKFSTWRDPLIVDSKKQDIIDVRNEVYSGCWGRCVCFARAYRNEEKRATGVNFLFSAFQKVRDDEKTYTGAGGDPLDELDEVDLETVEDLI